LPLELDHVEGNGNTHRREIKIKLEVWLWRQFQQYGVWDTQVQLLCKGCHDRKSGRLKHVPNRPDKRQVNIVVSEAVYGTLTAIAERDEYEGKIAKVGAHALNQFLEAHATEGVVDTFHMHLANEMATLRTALNEMQDALRMSTSMLAKLQAEVSKLHSQVSGLDNREYQHHERLIQKLSQKVENEPAKAFWRRS
jgi:uncharacterized protein YicC (UPF0701 family)